MGQRRTVHELMLVSRHTAERVVLAPLLRRAWAARNSRGSPGPSLTALTESQIMQTMMAGALPLVIVSLAVSFVSGLLLVASEIDNFPTSWIFWVKMGFILILLINGARMRSVERAMAGAGVNTDADWARLHTAAIASITLWLTVTFLGVALSKFA